MFDGSVPVAVVTINRPDDLNALSPPVMDEPTKSSTPFSGDRSVCVFVLTQAG